MTCRCARTQLRVSQAALLRPPRVQMRGRLSGKVFRPRYSAAWVMRNAIIKYLGGSYPAHRIRAVMSRAAQGGQRKQSVSVRVYLSILSYRSRIPFNLELSISVFNRVNVTSSCR